MPFGSIDARLFAVLKNIRPSCDRGLYYYPCQVESTEGVVHPRVYVVSLDQFKTLWSLSANLTRDLKIEEVARIEESASRLPPDIADKLYKYGESGMGYYAFRVLFRDGTWRDYLTGDAVDFIGYPDGKSQNDVVDVRPLTTEERKSKTPQTYSGPGHLWCLFNGVGSSTTSESGSSNDEPELNFGV
jgi:hypothetical protein